MDIRITTTSASIGIKTTNGRLDIQQPQAQMSINTQEPRLKIHAAPAKMQIDQYQCFAEAGQKNYSDMTRGYAALGMRRSMEGIATIARQGDQMANIHQGGNVIIAQAAQNGFPQDRMEFNFDAIPKSMPKIYVQQGKLDIQVQEGKVDVRVKSSSPKIHYTPGKVDIYLRQKNSIKVQYIGKKLNVLG